MTNRDENSTLSAEGVEYEPTWGSDSWPGSTTNDLDEGDQLLLHSMLALTPTERLKSLTGFVNGLRGIQRATLVRPG